MPEPMIIDNKMTIIAKMIKNSINVKPSCFASLINLIISSFVPFSRTFYII